MTFAVLLPRPGVAELVLNHPPVNAFSAEQFDAMTAEINRLGIDPTLKVLVIRAEGKGFCAGIDVKGLAEDPGSISTLNRAAYRNFEAIHRCGIPVIAAVHGYALGAGLAMVGASDIILAAIGARFGLPEIKVGMLGGAAHALRMISMQKVRRMYFTGEPILAEEMHRLGAVEAVYPAERLPDAARDLAAAIAANSATGLRFAKEALNGIEPVHLEQLYRYEQGFTFEISHLAAGRDARTAFAKKPL